MAQKDPLAGIITHLKTISAITTLTSTRIFGQELPRSEAANMPVGAAVLVSAGGLGSIEFTRYRVYRLDCRSYGETPKLAMDVHMAIDEELTTNLIRKEASDTYFYNASLDGGPLALRDPDADWPFVQASYLIRFSIETMS